jgi:hypothetical protein
MPRKRRAASDALADLIPQITDIIAFSVNCFIISIFRSLQRNTFMSQSRELGSDSIPEIDVLTVSSLGPFHRIAPLEPGERPGNAANSRPSRRSFPLKSNHHSQGIIIVMDPKVQIRSLFKIMTATALADLFTIFKSAHDPVSAKASF